MHNNENFIVSSFYKFVYLREPHQLKDKLIKKLNCFNIKGTFIIGTEGINGSFSVQSDQFLNIKHLIKKLISKDIKFHELGDVILDKEKGRKSDQDITIADLTGTGMQDTAIATFANERADKVGIGSKIKN